MGNCEEALPRNAPDCGHRVERAAEFAPLLEQCFTQGGAHIVDVPVDYSENSKVLVDELKEKVFLV